MIYLTQNNQDGNPCYTGIIVPAFHIYSIVKDESYFLPLYIHFCKDDRKFNWNWCPVAKHNNNCIFDYGQPGHTSEWWDCFANKMIVPEWCEECITSGFLALAQWTSMMFYICAVKWFKHFQTFQCEWAMFGKSLKMLVWTEMLCQMWVRKCCFFILSGFMWL